MVSKFRELIQTLARGNIDFIIVGGVAAVAHGSGRATFDLDIVYARDDDNIARLVNVLASYSPYLRDAPPDLPFIFDEKTVTSGLNFTLTTEIGNLDLLGEIVGGGTYKQLLPFSEKVTVFGVDCYCVGLEKLIQTKRAAGRPKDLEIIAELEMILEEGKK